VHLILRAVHRGIEQVAGSGVGWMRHFELIGKLLSQFVPFGDEALMNSQECIFSAHVILSLPTAAAGRNTLGPAAFRIGIMPDSGLIRLCYYSLSFGASTFA
jgi:hypothetical protein